MCLYLIGGVGGVRHPHLRLRTAVFSAVLYVHLDDNPIKYKVARVPKSRDGSVHFVFSLLPYILIISEILNFCKFLFIYFNSG